MWAVRATGASVMICVNQKRRTCSLRCSGILLLAFVFLSVVSAYVVFSFSVCKRRVCGRRGEVLAFGMLVGLACWWDGCKCCRRAGRA
jgi:hypothetical protein